MVNQPQRHIYFFGSGQADGGGEIRHLVGGKGASLADMTRAGLNVPPGFTISAECCDLYFRAGQHWPDGLEDEVRANLARLEQLAGRTFGRGGNPLLVSVRSGAARSMPGMMDTVLNVGLNPDCIRAMAQRTGNRRAGWEAYRHFLVMFGKTVAGIDEAAYTGLIAEILRDSGRQAEEELDADQLEQLCDRFLSAYRRHTGRDLPSEPWEMLRLAIEAVFHSWNSERAVTYRRHHKIEGLLGTAVNVQMMCPAEVSGVMFTANPVNPSLEQVIIEASYGLGEAIVLGKVTPDHFVLDKRSLRITDRNISSKEHVISPVRADGQEQKADRNAASLSDAQVTALAQLGLDVEKFFKTACDIEWAWAEGRFWLLQARPITKAGTLEKEQVRREEVEALRARTEPGGTVWARYNLAEILPAPTPMTWAIVSRFMSGRGGYGLMHRDLGFDPDPILDEEGFIDLICGRPYVNLSREPKLGFRHFPYGHDFKALKAHPERAMYPQRVVIPERATGWLWLQLPLIVFRMVRAHTRMKRQSQAYAEHLRQQVFPAFLKEVEAERETDLAKLSSEQLLARLHYWVTRTLDDFARESLRPSVFASLALEKLEIGLKQPLGAERAPAAVRALLTGVHPDPEADLPAALQSLGQGTLTTEAFLQRFGHRGPQEMELAQPRWAEAPELLDRSRAHGPGERHPKETPAERWQALSDEAKLNHKLQNALEPEFQKAQTYLALRETSKHYLMMGYALIRRLLAEIDRRHQLQNGIFYLLPEELPRLIAGEELGQSIAERQQRRAVALTLEVPAVIFSDDLEAIGRPLPVAAGGTELKGTALSAGVAEGPALVLEEPTVPESVEDGFVLVCPSTDPAWVPLFLRARGLVMETGGVLSHGAIVAREFGLPAVAGIANVHKRLQTGQRIRVDGNSGVVHVFG